MCHYVIAPEYICISKLVLRWNNFIALFNSKLYIKGNKKNHYEMGMTMDDVYSILSKRKLYGILQIMNT